MKENNTYRNDKSYLSDNNNENNGGGSSYDRRDSKPNGERKFGSRDGGDRPRSFGGDRPRGDRPSRDGDRPRSFGGGRPGGDRPRSFGGDRPGGDRPRSFGGDRPGGDRPRSFGGDRPGGDRPRSFGGDRPGGDRPRSFGGDRPGGDRPRSFGGDRPRRDGDRPRSFGGDRQGGDRPRSFGGDRPRSFGGDRPRFGDRRNNFNGPRNNSFRERPENPNTHIRSFDIMSIGDLTKFVLNFEIKNADSYSATFQVLNFETGEELLTDMINVTTDSNRVIFEKSIPENGKWKVSILDENGEDIFDKLFYTNSKSTYFDGVDATWKELIFKKKIDIFFFLTEDAENPGKMHKHDVMNERFFVVDKFYEKNGHLFLRIGKTDFQIKEFKDVPNSNPQIIFDGDKSAYFHMDKGKTYLSDVWREEKRNQQWIEGICIENKFKKNDSDENVETNSAPTTEEQPMEAPVSFEQAVENTFEDVVETPATEEIAQDTMTEEAVEVQATEEDVENTKTKEEDID